MRCPTSLLVVSWVFTVVVAGCKGGDSASTTPSATAAQKASEAPTSAASATAASAAAPAVAAPSATTSPSGSAETAEADDGSDTTIEPANAAGNARANSLGNTCYILYGKQEFDAARAACKEGLAQPGKSVFVHGAILFNLGLIAETTGDESLAASYFRKSLKVRPDGRAADAVRRALERVGG